jgi:hypothetical protein
MGQYKRRAFEKYLKKCRNFVPDEKKRRLDKNYMRDQWIERQADYIKYLWIEYQNSRYNPRDAVAIWTQAYNALSKEFKDFEALHEHAENVVKKEEVVHKTELLYELVDRINTSDQKLKQDRALALYNMLLDKKYKQNYKRAISAISTEVPLVRHAFCARGTNKTLDEIFDRERKQKELKDKKPII